MTSRVLRSPEDVDALATMLRARTKWPITVAVAQGAKRTNPQNALAQMWANEVAQQRGDHFEDVRAEFKLRHGVAILRRELPAFKEVYDRLLKPLDYASKIEAVRRLDLSVTRLMTTKQQSEYMESIEREYRSQGFNLTSPATMGLEELKR